jgi:hypothetical protein
MMAAAARVMEASWMSSRITPADAQAAEPVPLSYVAGRGADPHPSFGPWADCAR